MYYKMVRKICIFCCIIGESKRAGSARVRKPGRIRVVLIRTTFVFYNAHLPLDNMFRNNALAALRPILRARVAPTSLRTFATTPRALSGDHHGPTAPQLYGPGHKDGNTLPTDEEQATGLERFQLLGRMEGVDVFDMKELDSSRLGTMADPIKVPTYVRSFFFPFLS